MTYRVAWKNLQGDWVPSRVISDTFSTKQSAEIAISRHLQEDYLTPLDEYRVVSVVSEVSEAGRTPTPPSQDLKIGTSEKKPPLSLCPLGSLAGEARVRQYGNKKYADGNYLTADASKETVRRYISGVLRHLSVVQTSGVDALDEESGLPHLDHAIVGLRMLREIATKHGVIPEDPGEGNDPPRL